MNAYRVQLVSAFGRGETLALALHEAGFQVRILDFTSAFAAEYQRGVGPFPLVDQAFQPLQREFLQSAKTLTQGLSFWLKEGPLELTGPMSDIHAERHAEVQAWKTNTSSDDFGISWLGRFLKQWASPYFHEAWESTSDPQFPATAPLAVVPVDQESDAMSFARAQSRGIEVHSAESFGDSRMNSGRIHQIEAVVGTRTVFSADQWVWCLSSSETKKLGAELAAKVFWRGVRESDWSWIGFAGQMHKGPWSQGLPPYTVVIGDVYLPWLYANAFVLRRVDDTRVRVWLKVPLARVHDIDARREWTGEVQKVLLQRLPLADWKIDSAAWSLCPHSTVFTAGKRDDGIVQWKNWDWIAPETLPRLDLSARLQREADSLTRLTQWRTEQNKKSKGGASDQSLHAP